MLARHADSLYWMGRYVERAEHTARLLDVTYHTQLQAMPYAMSRTWEDLLAALDLTDTFTAAGRSVHPASVTDFLVLSDDNPSSLVGSVRQARENARSVRELLATELWQATNQFHIDLQRRNLEEDLDTHPHELYVMIRTMCQAITGVAHESMDRNEGFLFLLLGRMIERAQLVARLLDVRFSQFVSGGAAGGFQHWMLTLRSAAGSEAFRRNYQGSTDRNDVLSFLLLAPTFPRSVRFAVDTAERALVGIEGSDQHARPRRITGRIRADLEFAEADELLAGDVHVFLARLLDELHRANDAVADEYFRLVRDPVMTVGGER